MSTKKTKTVHRLFIDFDSIKDAKEYMRTLINLHGPGGWHIDPIQDVENVHTYKCNECKQPIMVSQVTCGACCHKKPAMGAA